MELAALQELATGLDRPEGITWGPDGRVYAGGEAGQVYAISLEGTVEEVTTTGGFLYGVTTDGDGAVYACDFGRGEVARIVPPGEVETYSTGHRRSSAPRPELLRVRRRREPLRHGLGRLGRGRRPRVPRRAGRDDRRVERRGPTVPERLLPERRRRLALRDRVPRPVRDEGPDRRRRLGRPAGTGRRAPGLPARRDRARGRRHALRRLLPAGPRLPDRTGRCTGDPVRRSRRGLLEPADERGVHRSRAGPAGDRQPRRVERRWLPTSGPVAFPCATRIAE